MARRDMPLFKFANYTSFTPLFMVKLPSSKTPSKTRFIYVVFSDKMCSDTGNDFWRHLHPLELFSHFSETAFLVGAILLHFFCSYGQGVGIREGHDAKV